MVDYGVKKTSKGVKKEQTKIRREKNMDDIYRPYLIQRVLAAPNMRELV